MKAIIQAMIKKYRGLDVIGKASICFIIVSVMDNGISALTQPFINRILSVSEVGLYSSYASWQSMITVIATFYLYAGVLEVLITKEKEDRDQVIGSLCSLCVLLVCFFFGILFLFKNTAVSVLGIKPEYILTMFLTIFGNSVIQFWMVSKKFSYEYKAYAILGVSLFLCKSVLSIVLAYFLDYDRVFGRILGLCIPNVIVAIIILVWIIRKTCIRELNKYWKRAIVFNIPLIPHYLSSILLSSSDRIMIQRQVGETEAGLYSVAYTFASLALVVFSAINNAYNPFAYAAIRDKRYDELAQKTNTMVFISVAFASGLCFFAPEGLYLLGGEKYREAIYILPVLILGIFFSAFYFIFSNVEFIYEKTKMIFPITILGAGINILLNYCLLPRMGYRVAAYTTLLGYIIIFIAHYFVSVRIVKRNIYDMKKLCVSLIVLGVICIIATVLYDFNPIIRYSFGFVVLAIGVFLFVRKSFNVTKKKDCV